MTESVQKCNRCLDPATDLVDGICERCRTVTEATVPPTPGNVNDATIAPSSTQPLASESDSHKGSDFAGYEIIGEIARGGMGVVYKARHKKLNRIAALKMILGGKFSSHEDLQRFQLEAEAAAKLDHPGIVPCYEIGEYDGQAFFAMKFIEGGALTEHMSRLRQNPREAVELLAKVADAVHHAHQRGILHRDLKPANILIDKEGQPLIADLGLAKSTGADSNLTHTGAVLGTPSYMPPEQAGGTSVTTAADTYSIGAIMYELLTGQAPYQGESTIEVVMKVLDAPPPSPGKLNPSVDKDLELICMKCLERNPDDRYGTASELADDLEAWLIGEPISVMPPTLYAMAGRWFRKNRKLVYFSFALLAGLAFCIPFLVLFLGMDVQNVYSNFPADQKPILYAIEEMPVWIVGTAMITVVFVLWPLIGLVSAMISKSRTLGDAVVRGLLTSFVFGLVFSVAIGWLVLSQNVANTIDTEVTVLAKAVWPAGNPEALENANQLFGGVEDIPEQHRGQVIADRIYHDAIASGVLGLIIVIGVTFFFAIPIFYGTLIGALLMRRGHWLVILLIRYMIAWGCITLGIGFIISYSLDRVKGLPEPFGVYVVLAFFGFVFYLTMRKWRKEPALNMQESSNVFPIGQAT